MEINYRLNLQRQQAGEKPGSLKQSGALRPVFVDQRRVRQTAGAMPLPFSTGCETCRKESQPMEKVVVTGAKGGTGLSIVRVLREAGYQVLGIDLKPCDVLEEDYRQLDLQDGAGVHDAFAGATAVIHFGSLPTDSWTSWETAYRNLAVGGYHVLQAVANLQIPRVVLAGSPMVYGEYSRVPYLPLDEQTPQVPDGIYGAVKQNLESLAGHYARWHGVAIASLRPQRIVYEGSYEWRFRRFTETDAAAADSLWSYIDARDVATACLAWIKSDRTGFEAFNLAADDVCVATPTRQLLAKYYAQVSDLRCELHDAAGLVSCGKIKQMIGWQPQYTWRRMAAESEARNFPKTAPAR